MYAATVDIYYRDDGWKKLASKRMIAIPKAGEFITFSTRVAGSINWIVTGIGYDLGEPSVNHTYSGVRIYVRKPDFEESIYGS